MRVVGIDPGTKGFSIFGIDGDRIFLDTMFSTQDIFSAMPKMVELLAAHQPLDAVVGPSGYGLPITFIDDITESDMDLMLPKRSEKVSVNEAIKNFIRFAKAKKLPIYFTPGVIHLPTVPVYRKANKLDMGTADKLCCAVLALEQSSLRNSVPYSSCSLILLEIGYGFTAAIGIDKGKVVDGLGGTSGFAGFLSPGAIDAELAIRIKEQPQDVVFTGGAAGRKLPVPGEDVEAAIKRPGVWETIIESAVKDVAAISVTTPSPEIIVSGRLARIPDVMNELEKRLGKFGKVFRLVRRANSASEGAEGAALIGMGLLGGRSAALVECLELKAARGTMFDYITMGVEIL